MQTGINQASPNNYRPVSLTNQVVKFMERLTYDQILDLTKRNGIIPCDQHGFQEQCSCVTQFLKSLNDWSRNFDEQTQTDFIYLDFSEAFNMVPHNRLLLKLKGPSQLAGSPGEDTAWRFGKGTLQLATQIARSCRMDWWSAKEIQKFNTTRGHGRGRPEKTWTEVIHKGCLALGLNKTHPSDMKAWSGRPNGVIYGICPI